MEKIDKVLKKNNKSVKIKNDMTVYDEKYFNKMNQIYTNLSLNPKESVRDEALENLNKLNAFYFKILEQRESFGQLERENQRLQAELDKI